MDGFKFIESIKVNNLLSFGPESEELKLEPLNVLIGPNASGKSNFLSVIFFIKSLSDDLVGLDVDRGTIYDWFWKGKNFGDSLSVDLLDEKNGVTYRFSLSITYSAYSILGVSRILDGNFLPEEIRHEIAFSCKIKDRIVIEHEKIYQVQSDNAPEESDNNKLIYEYPDCTDNYIIRDRRKNKNDYSKHEELYRGEADRIDRYSSVLNQFRDKEAYPEITILSTKLQEFRQYFNWNIDAIRKPQKNISLSSPFIYPSGRNLASTLLHLSNNAHDDFERIKEYLRRFYPPFKDITFFHSEDFIQILFHEDGLELPIPASNISDGTLRYLCLLTVLLHPSPPPLICIEEPEKGLHPDIIPTIAELMIEASQRTQLIVTTHSPDFVSALSEVPEAVLVCERDDTGTKMTRLDAERLKEWLDDYDLGDLWIKGEIGGTRF